MILVIALLVGVYFWGFSDGRKETALQFRRFLIKKGIFKEEYFVCEKDWLKD